MHVSGIPVRGPSFVNGLPPSGQLTKVATPAFCAAGSPARWQQLAVELLCLDRQMLSHCSSACLIGHASVIAGLNQITLSASSRRLCCLQPDRCNAWPRSEDPLRPARARDFTGAVSFHLLWKIVECKWDDSCTCIVMVVEEVAAPHVMYSRKSNAQKHDSPRRRRQSPTNG